MKTKNRREKCYEFEMSEKIKCKFWRFVGIEPRDDLLVKTASFSLGNYKKIVFEEVGIICYFLEMLEKGEITEKEFRSIRTNETILENDYEISSVPCKYQDFRDIVFPDSFPENFNLKNDWEKICFPLRPDDNIKFGNDEKLLEEINNYVKANKANIVKMKAELFEANNVILVTIGRKEFRKIYDTLDEAKIVYQKFTEQIIDSNDLKGFEECNLFC